MSKKIVITINAEGETTVEAVGHAGGTCVKATQPLTKALIGGTPDTSVKKPEFYQGDHTQKVPETE
jgi:hypothetical protein|tara:strand:- start:68 stop:265 length:198 start_codon:yes stop_codon:yes gene_type:complete